MQKYNLYFYTILFFGSMALFGTTEEREQIQYETILYAFGDINDFQLAPDGSRFAVASSNGFFIWNAEPFGLEHAEWLTDTADYLLWSPDGSTLLVYFHEKQQVTIYETKRFTQILTINIEANVNRRFYYNPFAFSQDSRRILLFHTYDSFAELWDIESGIKLHIFPHESNITGSVQCTSAGQVITAASGHVKIWGADEGLLVQEYPLGIGSSECYFSPDGSYFLHKYPAYFDTGEIIKPLCFQLDIHETNSGTFVKKIQMNEFSAGNYAIFFSVDSSEVYVVETSAIHHVELRDDFPIDTINLWSETYTSLTGFIFSYCINRERMLFYGYKKLPDAEESSIEIYLVDLAEQRILGTIVDQPASTVSDWKLMR